jgi:hypothetical protein
MKVPSITEIAMIHGLITGMLERSGIYFTKTVGVTDIPGLN